jgi:hypothetical protein
MYSLGSMRARLTHSPSCSSLCALGEDIKKHGLRNPVLGATSTGQLSEPSSSGSFVASHSAAFTPMPGQDLT